MPVDLAETLKQELANSRLKRKQSVDDSYHGKSQSRRILWGRDQGLFKDRFEQGKLLGKGAFASTWVVKDKQTGLEYACKTIDKSKVQEPRLVDAVRLEVEIMLHLNGHPHIVSLIGCYEDDAEVHMVLELCRGGALNERMKANGLPYSELQAAKLIRSIVLAVAHCHSLRVLHRDVKPENFLLATADPDSAVKAADFGLSVFLDRGERIKQACGTPLYVAPEVLGGEGYSFPADMWSCGVMLYRLLCGRFPFGDAPSNLQYVYQRILHTDPDLESHAWKQVSPQAKDCVRHMLNKDPAQRATAQDVLNHSWLAMHGCAGDVPLFTPIIDRVREFASCNPLKKAALRHVAENSEIANFIGLRKIFDELDVDHSGGISTRDMSRIARRFPLPGISQEMQEPYYGILVQHADTNHDGVVDFCEFVTTTVSRLLIDNQEKLMAAFEQFDSDGDGALSSGEVRAACGPLCRDDAELEALMQQLDADGDGAVTFEDFRAMMVRREPLTPLPDPHMHRANSQGLLSRFTEAMKLGMGLTAPSKAPAAASAAAAGAAAGDAALQARSTPPPTLRRQWMSVTSLQLLRTSTPLSADSSMERKKSVPEPQPTNVRPKSLARTSA